MRFEKGRKREMKKEVLGKKKNKIVAIGVCFGLCVALVISGFTYAYFTDTNEKVNSFSFGNVKSSVVETAFDSAGEQAHNNLAPNCTLAKDPKVVNEGSLDMYTFLKVTVPHKEATYVSSDGKVKNGAIDLFTYSTNSGWVLVDTINGSDEVSYVYAYAGADANLTAIAPNSKTTTLFDNITFANVTEGQGIEGRTFDVTVKDYSIQVSDLGNNKATNASEVWSIVSNQSAGVQVAK